MKKKLLITIMVTSLIMILFVSVKRPLAPPEKLSFFALDTVISLTGYGKSNKFALDEMKAQIIAMEKELSRTMPDSTVYSLNHAEGKSMSVPSNLAYLLSHSQDLSKMTDGIFDITIAPAADLWGFTKDAFHVPGPEEIETIRPKIGMDHLHVNGNTVRLDNGSQIDLGGIAKGYALEQSLDIFQKYSMDGGIVNLGGDVLAYGSNMRGAPWNVAIQDPDCPQKGNNTLGVLSTKNRYILTSGSYERYFEENGRKYQHIIDPFTCSPAESTLQSATVVTSLDRNSGMTADAFATALVIMGYKNAVSFWQNSDLHFDMILIDHNGSVYITDGLKDKFTPTKPDKYHYIYLSKSSES